MPDAPRPGEAIAPKTPGGGKKKKGKSGANAPKTLRSALLAQREESVAGGTRTVAKMPGLSEKPGIIALGTRRKTVPETIAQPGKKRAAAVDPEDAADAMGGAKVFGIEPQIANARIGVIVSASAFTPIRSAIMTLLIKSDPEKRVLLRIAGMSMSGDNRATLTFQCADSGEATATAEAFLQAGEARLYDAALEA